MTPKVAIIEESAIEKSFVIKELLNIGIKEVFCVSNYDELHTLSDDDYIDVLIVDSGLFNKYGHEITSHLSRKHPELKIILFGSCDHELVAFSYIKTGIKGYVLYEDEVSSIAQAVLRVSNGGYWISPKVIERIIRVLICNGKLEFLSNRELYVLSLLSEGRKEKDIAFRLQLSERTVRYCIKEMIKKIGMSSKIQAITWAIKNGLTSINDSSSG